MFEKWESEFLQMSAYVVLIAVLCSEDRRKRAISTDRCATRILPRRRGVRVHLPSFAPAHYGDGPMRGRSASRSFLFFLLSFFLHWTCSTADAAADAVRHGAEPRSAYLLSSRAWFESFQNWQSELLSTAVLVVHSIYLRQRESPESKPVAAPHAQTRV